MFDGSWVILPPRVFFDSRIECLPLLMPSIHYGTAQKHGCVCFHESNGLSTNCSVDLQISLHFILLFVSGMQQLTSRQELDSEKSCFVLNMKKDNEKSRVTSQNFTVSMYQYIDDPVRAGHKSDLAYATQKSNK